MLPMIKTQYSDRTKNDFTVEMWGVGVDQNVIVMFTIVNKNLFNTLLNTI